MEIILFQTEAIINKDNLIHNINYIKKYVDGINVMPVVKANAYGHGIVEICKILSKCNVHAFCVALLSEAEKISDKLFDETTTIGVRRCRQFRRLVSREFIDVDGIRVKLADRPSGLSAKAEMDDFVDTKGQLERSKRRNQAERKAKKKRK